MTALEIAEEVNNFDEFVKNYSYEDASEAALDYAVVYTAAMDPLKNLDRWYKRDGGETVGEYTLYRLELRDAEQ